MMKEILIDTNIIMRLFDTTSEPIQTKKAKLLFEQAKAGRHALIVAPPVLFEVAWVLRSALKWTNNEVLDVLEAIVSWEGVNVMDKGHVKAALSLGKKHDNGFADSYLAVTAKNHNLEVATFDTKHFNKLDIVLHEIK
jgi:predicted nucleic acid-binding protein